MFTKDLKVNNHFYTEVLGLRRVKISVNQGDTGMYHVFYGDTTGSAGNDLTFLKFLISVIHTEGQTRFPESGLLVSSYESLEYWQKEIGRI